MKKCVCVCVSETERMRVKFRVCVSQRQNESEVPCAYTWDGVPPHLITWETDDKVPPIPCQP